MDIALVPAPAARVRNMLSFGHEHKFFKTSCNDIMDVSKHLKSL